MPGVAAHVELTADLSSIPEAQFKQERGLDDKMYYKMNFGIEIICYSAATRYSLIYNGTRYDTVTAEYMSAEPKSRRAI
jgi:hypothetical protein